MQEENRRRAIQRQLSGMGSVSMRRGVQAVRTGFAGLDAAFGIGGVPRAAITEIFGPASSGKTALALQIIAHGQSRGSAAAWIDADHAFDAAFASHLGVDVSRLPVAAPESAEEALGIARQFVSSQALDLIVIDSVAALVPRLELEAGLGQAGAGLHSRVLSSELRRLAQAVIRSGAALVLLNQTRVRPGTTGGAETSAGGLSIKLHAAVRLALSASGRRVRVRVVKNQFSAAFTEAHLEWRRTLGFVEGP
jgi:recombination protein RecA